MQLTDALLGEHAVIYELFEHVRDTIPNSDDIRDVHGAVAVVARLLVSHARIEEDMLFPHLDPHLGEMGPLTVMRDEHRDIEDLLESAQRETDVAAAKATTSQLLDLAHEHFQKEEMVLFPLAREHLGEARLSELGDDWAVTRKVTVDG
jgi:hemerythrin-like domain-containing protein